MMKYVWAVIGGGILIFGFTMFFPAIEGASNVTSNEIAASVGNYDGLGNFITFTPLLLWGALFCIPVVIVAVYLWQRRQRAGG
jgi:hypothetical protein